MNQPKYIYVSDPFHKRTEAYQFLYGETYYGATKSALLIAKDMGGYVVVRPYDGSQFDDVALWNDDHAPHDQDTLPWTTEADLEIVE